MNLFAALLGVSTDLKNTRLVKWIPATRLMLNSAESRSRETRPPLRAALIRITGEL